MRQNGVQLLMSKGSKTDPEMLRKTTRRAVYEAVWESPLSQVAAAHGLTPAALYKICDRMQIPYPDREQRRQISSGLLVPRTPLPALSDGASEQIALDGQRAHSRRFRTRLPSEERRTQMLNMAADVTHAEGVHAVTIKSIARRIGISEAQAFNVFPGRVELLTELARRELEILDKSRRTEADRGTDRTTRIVLSTVHYIRGAAERGALIQGLLSIPEVRKSLKTDDSLSSRRQQDKLVQTMVATDGAEPQIARALMSIMNAMVIRAGRLVANGHVSIATAEQICVPMVVEGNRHILKPRRRT